MIAIVLVGILSSVVVVGVGQLTSRGSTASCAASQDAARAAATVHLGSTGSYPTTFGQMTGGSSPSLTLPAGASVNASGDAATVGAWTLWMAAGSGSTPPTFTCLDGSAWTPAVLAGVALWLDAADQSTLTTAAGAVSEWRDRSGGNRHVTQAAAGNRPVIGAAALNGRPAVTFDGADDFMVVPLGAASVNNQGSVFTAFRTAPGTESNYHALLSWSFGSPSGVGVGPLSTAGSFGLYGTFGSGAGNLFNVGPISTNTPYVASLGWSNGGLSVNGGLNGANVAGTRTVAYNQTGATAHLGRDNTAYSGAAIGEMIVVTTNLSTADRQRVEGYLAHKWGLAASLPVGHPFRSAPPGVTS